jgi:hypothetical protein
MSKESLYLAADRDRLRRELAGFRFPPKNAD